VDAGDVVRVVGVIGAVDEQQETLERVAILDQRGGRVVLAPFGDERGDYGFG